MACTQITTGGSIALVPGTLGGSFCHKSWQKTYEDFITATSANFTNGAVFAAGSEAPSVGSTVWFKQDTDAAADPCNAMGWHWKKSGTWTPVPVPAEALPSGVVTASTKGSASANAVVTVDTYGRVTSLTEVAPSAETTDGHAKAWVKFNSVGGSSPSASIIDSAYNVPAVNRTGTGQFTITTADVGFSNTCLVIASSPGFGAEDLSAGSFTGADHVRVINTTVSGGAGTATLELPRMVPGTQDVDDGDIDWDNDKGEAPTAGVSVVFFGN